MIRILDQFVAAWHPFFFHQDGELFEQVEVYLFNGMFLIMNMDEFLELATDESELW